MAMSGEEKLRGWGKKVQNWNKEIYGKILP